MHRIASGEVCVGRTRVVAFGRQGVVQSVLGALKAMSYPHDLGATVQLLDSINRRLEAIEKIMKQDRTEEVLKRIEKMLRDSVELVQRKTGP